MYGSGKGSGSGPIAVRECTRGETLGAELVMNRIGVGSKEIFPDLPTNMILSFGAIFPN